MRKIGRTVALLALVAMTIGCDRVTKHIAATSLEGALSRSLFADTVRLEYAENKGGFLSLGADLPPAVRTAIFTIGAGLLLIGSSLAALKLRLTGWPLVGLCLWCAGGASNWLDRVVHGGVVDFLNVGIGALRTGIFNVADVAIMLGVCLLVFTYHQPNLASKTQRIQKQ